MARGYGASTAGTSWSPVCFQSDFRATIQALGWWPDGWYQPLADDVASVAYWYPGTSCAISEVSAPRSAPAPNSEPRREEKMPGSRPAGSAIRVESRMIERNAGQADRKHAGQTVASPAGGDQNGYG